MSSLCGAPKKGPPVLRALPRRLVLLSAIVQGLLASTAALAQTSVGDGTTPLNTSTANNNAPDDLTVTGTLTISGPGPAITLDSNNALTLSGVVSITDQDNAVGVRLVGGNTGSFTQTGTITVTSSFTPTDANTDGVVEAPFTTGLGRFGVQISGGAFNGAVSTGAITVRGDDSFGVALNDGGLNGALTLNGPISVTGANAVGVSVRQGITGDLTLNSSVAALGAGAQGVLLAAPVDGRFSIYSVVSATGFGTTARPTVAATLSTVQATPSEVELGGAAVTIGANVGGGVLLGAPPVGAPTGESDADGDAVEDDLEGTASVVSFGSAPALAIGSTSGDITIGAFQPNVETALSNFDLIIRGSVNGLGVFDGFSATGVFIGGTGFSTTLNEGVRITGNINAAATQADATALRFGSAALIGSATDAIALLNDGRITASVAPTGADVTSPIPATGGEQAAAVLIDAGASAPTIINNGTIIAGAIGDSASAFAIRDASGTTTSVLNQGVLTASLSAATSGATPSGRAVALDVRAATGPFSFTQQTNVAPLLNLTTGVSLQPAAPSTAGDLLLGSGANTVNLLAGTVSGDIDFGGGAGSSLTIDGGAVYRGALSNIGSGFALSIVDGVFANTAVTTYSGLSSLNVGANGRLGVVVDPANGTATRYEVLGDAVLADGAGVSTSIISPIATPTAFTIVSATGQIVANADALSLGADVPFFYTASLSNSGSDLQLLLARKTATEAGVSAQEASAYDALYAHSFSSPALLTTFNAETGQSGFTERFRSLLPDHGTGTLLTAIKGAETAAYAGQNAKPNERGAWAREFGFGLTRDGGPTPKARIAGFGVALGLESRQTVVGRFQLLGDFFTARTTSSDLPDVDQFNLSVLDIGLGWRVEKGGLRFGAVGKAGRAQTNTDRQFQFVNADGSNGATTQISGDAKGSFFTGVANLGYHARLGAGFYLEPQGDIAYYRLKQDAYAETGDAAVALNIDARTGHAAKARGALEFGREFGDTVVLRPHVLAGYERTLSINPGLTNAAFADGEQFSLGAEFIDKSRKFARIGFTAEGESLGIDVDIGGTTGADGSDYDGRVTLRAKF